MNGVYDKLDFAQTFVQAVGEEYKDYHFELPSLLEQVKSFSGLDVLDLGCGHGRLIKVALKDNVKSMIGIDNSEKIMKIAAGYFEKEVESGRVRLITCSMNDMDLPDESLDMVVSSLAIQLSEDYEDLVQKIYKSLKPGGRFVFNVAHPINTSGCEYRWIKDDSGKPIAWGVQSYFDERVRNDSFIIQNYQTMHRTLSTYFNTLLENGFAIKNIAEPSSEIFTESKIRPHILQISCVKI